MKKENNLKKIDELCDIRIGGTPSRSNSEYWDNGDNLWLSIADMSHSGKFINDTKEKITKKGIEMSNVKLIPKDTLLFSFKLSIGKLAFAGLDMYTNEAIAGLVIKDEKILDKDYLYYFLSQMTFDDTTSAVKGKTLNKEKIKNLEICLPSLSVQKNIVKILGQKIEKLNKIKAIQQESIFDTEKILSKKLYEIFNTEHIKGHTYLSLGDNSIIKMSSGGTPSRNNRDFYNGNIPWLKSGELEDNIHIISSEEKITNEAIEKSSAKIFPKGTVLFAMYGATAGKIGILGIDSATNQAIAGLIPCIEKLDSKFLYYYLYNKRSEIILKAWGGAQPNISQTILKNFTIPVPSIIDQQKIVKQLDTLVDKINTLKQLQKSQIEDFKKLEKAYLKEAFNRELTK